MESQQRQHYNEQQVQYRQSVTTNGSCFITSSLLNNPNIFNSNPIRSAMSTRVWPSMSKFEALHVFRIGREA